MKTVFTDFASLGVLVTLAGYLLGTRLQKKTGSPLCSPPLIAAVFVILCLKLAGADYAAYQNSARYISFLLTPATVCLAIPFYRQAALLKNTPARLQPGLCPACWSVPPVCCSWPARLAWTTRSLLPCCPNQSLPPLA